ncbi:MAG: Tex family protein, partial [Pseudomonadota bacterium]
MEIQQLIAQDISAEPRQVQAAIQLLDDGATVPFIARYRKEVTGGLSDTQLRLLAERLTYLRELDERRQSILKSIREQGHLTAELEQSILGQTTKQSLEDLYLPFRPKRRNKATQAREAGLQPFADALLNGQIEDPEAAAQSYIDAEKGIADSKSALEGARHIIMEQLAEIPELVSTLRERLKIEGWIFSKVKNGQETKGQKFKDYFAFEEKISTIPSHRILALFRGRRAGFLDLHIDMKWQNNEQKIHPCVNEIIQRFPLPTEQHAGHAWLLQAFEWTWKIKLYTSLQSELFMQLKEEADSEAIRIFSKNLKDLLMTAPAGNHVTLGLDPGLRTGVKAVVVSATGDILEHCSVFPHPPQQEVEKSSEELIRLCKTHSVTLIAIGNGTASRETQKWANTIVKSADIAAQTVVVSEAGASVYSASEFASKELPDLDVSYRGAVSIARRLQDPLSELVKIDPKSIGVGQYQHDVRSQRLLASLDAVVEDCVNAVGVDLNTASEALLRYVAGLNPIIAQQIVQYRSEHGTFKNRNQLREVPRLGQRTFEQAAGFLRIRGGDQPLDASGVHPESYSIVEKIVASANITLNQLLGNAELLQKLPINDFVNENASEITIKDILYELEKPGRDPRPSFKMAH